MVGEIVYTLKVRRDLKQNSRRPVTIRERLTAVKKQRKKCAKSGHTVPGSLLALEIELRQLKRLRSQPRWNMLILVVALLTLAAAVATLVSQMLAK